MVDLRRQCARKAWQIQELHTQHLELQRRLEQQQLTIAILENPLEIRRRVDDLQLEVSSPDQGFDQPAVHDGPLWVQADAGDAIGTSNTQRPPRP